MTNSAPIDDVSIGGEGIRLGQFLKFAGALDSGGDVKEAIIDGLVTGNGEVDRRRGRQPLLSLKHPRSHSRAERSDSVSSHGPCRCPAAAPVHAAGILSRPWFALMAEDA